MTSLLKKEPYQQSDIPWEKDELNRQEVADYLTRIIASIHQPFVISLNSPYGTGKTFFLQNWKKQLKDDGYTAIYFDAWEVDFDNEPIIPLINALLKEIDQSAAGDKAKKSLQGALGAAALMANNALDKFTGIDVKEILNTVEEDLKNDDLTTLGAKISQNFHLKKTIYKNLTSGINAYIETLEKKPLIILIDELDRCRPNYAIEVLECIKHLFNIENVVFILAIDEEQIKSTISSTYGLNDEGEGYLRKFIDWQLNLPKPSAYKYATYLYEAYDLEKTNTFRAGKFIDDGKDTLITMIGLLSTYYQLSLRQMAQLFTDINLYVRSLPDNGIPFSLILGLIVTLKYAIPNDDLKRYCTGETSCFLLLEELEQNILTNEHLKSFGNWEHLKPLIHSFFTSEEERTQLQIENEELMKNIAHANATGEQSTKRQEWDKRVSYISSVLDSQKSKRYYLHTSVAEYVYKGLEKASFLTNPNNS